MSMCLCSPMPDDLDLQSAGPPACSRYPDCDTRNDQVCGWPDRCAEEKAAE